MSVRRRAFCSCCGREFLASSGPVDAGQPVNCPGCLENAQKEQDLRVLDRVLSRPIWEPWWTGERAP